MGQRGKGAGLLSWNLYSTIYACPMGQWGKGAGLLFLTLQFNVCFAPWGNGAKGLSYDWPNKIINSCRAPEQSPRSLWGLFKVLTKLLGLVKRQQVNPNFFCSGDDRPHKMINSCRALEQSLSLCDIGKYKLCSVRYHIDIGLRQNFARGGVRGVGLRPLPGTHVQKYGFMSRAYMSIEGSGVDPPLNT